MRNFIKKFIKYLKRIMCFCLKLFRASTIYQINNLNELKADQEQSLTVFVFSKDRPMQLDLFIKSYYHYTKPAIKPIVIYNASSPEFELAYQELFKTHAENLFKIKSDKNSGFKKTFEALLRESKDDLVVCFVDDIIFKNSLDWNEFTQFSTKLAVPSLRLGSHLNYCYTAHASQVLPPHIEHEKFIIFKWNEGEHDWNYPLSVDGNIFSRIDFLQMVEPLNYKAPNTLELQLQSYNKKYKKMLGICKPLSPIVNNPANIVQNEIKNLHGLVHQEDLLIKWNEGKRINFKNFHQIKNISCHQELEFIFDT